MYYINNSITYTSLLSQKPRQCGNCGSNLLDARASHASACGRPSCYVNDKCFYWWMLLTVVAAYYCWARYNARFVAFALCSVQSEILSRVLAAKIRCVSLWVCYDDSSVNRLQPNCVHVMSLFFLSCRLFRLAHFAFVKIVCCCVVVLPLRHIPGESKIIIPCSFCCSVYIWRLISTIFSTEYIEIICKTNVIDLHTSPT